MTRRLLLLFLFLSFLLRSKELLRRITGKTRKKPLGALKQTRKRRTQTERKGNTI
jgi:hypothetical protein